ncbi:small ribosomal subunit protein mS25-like [Amphiura filiformis]|uniref:small ribosomal subunit protein mS25-like n=1 Tax=Amphiura filiformis TaxID=82378 RepID=UPI003B21247A
MPMRGKFPIRRTLKYLEAGKVHLRENVRILTINYTRFGKQSQGTRDFVFWHLPQLQFKNPIVQMQTFQDITPSPFIRAFLADGGEVLIDIDGKDKSEILERLNKVLGKSEDLLLAERHTEQKLHNPSNFGFENPRKCICVVPGQVPCPLLNVLPKELRGKFKESLKDRSLKPELEELPTYPNFKKIMKEEQRLKELEEKH